MQECRMGSRAIIRFGAIGALFCCFLALAACASMSEPGGQNPQGEPSLRDLPAAERTSGATDSGVGRGSGRGSVGGLRPAPQNPLEAEPEPERIDIFGLRRSLGLDRESLGYEEKSFATCEVGYGYARDANCRERRIVVVRFKIDCRNSDGTEPSSTSYQTWPLGATELAWALAGQRGNTRTDGDGVGEVALIAPASPRSQKLRVTRENDFLLVTAGEARRIVAPRSWCNP
jgi:hypothetical protein